MGEGRYVKFIGDDMFDSVKLLNITEVHLIGLQLDIIGEQTFIKTPNLRILDLRQQSKAGYSPTRYCGFIEEYFNTSPQIK